MSYARLIIDHDRIRAQFAEIDSMIASTATPPARITESLSQLSVALEDHAHIELNQLCPMLLSSGDLPLVEAGHQFRSEVEALREVRQEFFQDWSLECIEVDRDEFHLSFRDLATLIDSQAMHEEKGIYPVSLSKGMLPLRDQ